MAFLYAVTFGGFVAFSTYLPTYLKDVYDFDLTAAGTRTAGFAIAAVIARPIGGDLSDQSDPRTVMMVSLAGAAVMAIIIALQPPPEIPAGHRVRADGGLPRSRHRRDIRLGGPTSPRRTKVGTVTGIVGAAGGLGGYFPPLVMGATYNEETHSYTIGLVLLCFTALGTLVFTIFGFKNRQPAA